MNTQYDNRVRIIGGDWRGRRLQFPPLAGLRPTPDRVRETLFNWLQGDIVSSRCLDLFAGSGSLGFEALSRGAASLVQVEQEAEVAAQLQRSAQTLGCDGVVICNTSAAEWIAAQAQQPDTAGYSIIFLDPPFTPDNKLLLETCALLNAAVIPAPGAKVYLESSARLCPQQLPSGWQLLQRKQAGDVHYALALCPPAELN